MLMPANTSDPSFAATLGYVGRRLIAAVLGALVARICSSKREWRTRCRSRPGPRDQPGWRLARHTAYGDRLLEARRRAGRSRRLPDPAQPLRPRTCRGESDRARSSPAEGTSREGSGQSVLPHARHRAARLLALHDQPRASEHHQLRAQCCVETPDPSGPRSSRPRTRQGFDDVFVTHGSVITDATGEVVEEGETLVVRPRGARRFAVLGRVLPGEWAASASTSLGLRTSRARVRRARRLPSSRRCPGERRHGLVHGTTHGRARPARSATGKTTEIPLGAGSAPHGVIVGPDGAAWVTDGGLNAIVRVDSKTGAVKRFPLPASNGWANLNTATFDRRGVLWFTGQSGIYGRLDPRTGAMRVFRAPLGAGPYGIATTPKARSGTRRSLVVTSRRSMCARARRRSSARRRATRARGESGRTPAAGSGSASGMPARWRATTPRRGAGASGGCRVRPSRTRSTSTGRTSSG